MADNFNLDDILDEYSDKAKNVTPLSDADVDELIGADEKKEDKADKTEKKSIIDDSIFNEVIDDGRPKETIKAEVNGGDNSNGGIDDIDIDAMVEKAVSDVGDTPVLENEEPTLVNDNKPNNVDSFTLPDIEVDDAEISDNENNFNETDNVKKHSKGFAKKLSRKIEEERERLEAERAEEEEAEREGLEAGMGSRFRLRKTSGNTAIIEGLLKLKRERGTVNREANVSPVKRLRIKDVDLGLEGKIIPRTEQLEKINLDDDEIIFPEGATDTMKLRILAERRKDKVDNFVLENPEAEKKADVKDSEARKHVKDFTDYNEAPKVLEDILQLKSNLVIRLCILVITSFFSLYIAFANDLGWPIIEVFRRTSAESFIFTNIALGLVSAFVSYTVLTSGIKKLIKRNADCDSVAALGIVTSLISSLLLFINPGIMQTRTYHIYMSVAILGLLFNTLGKLLIVNRTERSFKYVAGEYDKFAVTNVLNEDIASKFTKGALLNDFPELATMRKTEFNNNFLEHSYSMDIADKCSRKYAPILLAASVLVGLLALIFDRNAAGFSQKLLSAFAAFSGTISISSSFALMLVVNLPLARASKRFLRSSGVMLGYSAVEEFADTNSILVDSRQLFPEGMINLVNLKAMSATPIEESILMAASLSCQAGSVLQSMFYNMLRGKIEMLYPVESYIYEDGLGLSGWIDNQRILFGTRELMENHSIEGLPPLSKEKEYTKGYIPVYLSISGVVSTLFVITVNSSISVKKWLQVLENQNITTVIRSVDGFISLNLMSELFDISPDSLKFLPFRYHNEYEDQTGFIPKASASMLCSGHFPSFAMLISGAKKLQFITNLGMTVQLAAALLGLLIALVMMLVGSFSSLSATVVILYNLLLSLLSLGVQYFRKL